MHVVAESGRGIWVRETEFGVTLSRVANGVQALGLLPVTVAVSQRGV